MVKIEVKKLELFRKDNENTYLIVTDKAKNHWIFKALDENSKEGKEILQLVRMM